MQLTCKQLGENMDGDQPIVVSAPPESLQEALILHQRLCALETECDRIRMRLLSLEKQYHQLKDDGK